MFFKEIPNDPDTEILENKYITIFGVLAVHQIWKWDGIVGYTIVIPMDSLIIIPEEYLIEELQKLQDIQQEITRSDNEGFIFYNYQFEKS